MARKKTRRHNKKQAEARQAAVDEAAKNAGAPLPTDSAGPESLDGKMQAATESMPSQSSAPQTDAPHLPQDRVEEPSGAPFSHVAPTGAEPLAFLRPQETQRQAKARRSPRYILFLRYILPASALLVLILLTLWPLMNPGTVASVVSRAMPDLVIQNLHFTGLDSRNQPYSLSAAKATRPGGFQNIFDLERPEGELTTDAGAWIAGKSQHGRLDQAHRRLWLGGDVQLFHDRGYQFTTDEAQIDLKDYVAWGEKPVLIQGDFGEIRGQGFRVLDSGDVVVVLGPASARLNLHAGVASDKPTVLKKQD